MNLSELFIRRPVMTTLLMLALLVFGIMAFWKLPVSDLPQIDFPTIQVSAALPGANPDTMASSVATPLEKQFTQIAGLEAMSSSSTPGNTQISLQFSLDRNIDAAAQDVQAAISRALGNLPPDLPSPPSFVKANPADSPILYLALTSPTLPLYRLDDYGETMMAQRISTVAGVAQVQIYGAQKYAVRVQMDPQKLAAQGLAINDVAKAVQNANVNLPTGTLEGRTRSFTIQATGQLVDAKGFEPTILRAQNGNIVRLWQVGRAIDSVQNDKAAAWYASPPQGVYERSIILAIQRQPGTNTIQVVNQIKAMLPGFEQLLPASATLRVLYDRSESIRESVADVESTLVLSLGLVVLVIFLFLRSLRATIIPSLAIPLSLVGTFAVMYAFGYSVDNLSLMALTLSIGFVVDDAIVMLENCVRHMESGEPPLAAALRGSREIGFTILSMTLSLAAVFIPFLFMAGMLGRLLHEFAVTIAAAILLSGLVSLTLTPMLCSRFLKAHGPAKPAALPDREPSGDGRAHHHPAAAPGELPIHRPHQAPEEARRHNWMYNAMEGVFNAWLWLYEVSLRFVLRHRFSAMLVSLVILAATVWLFIHIPKGFIPAEDMNQIIGFTEASQGISFQDMIRHQQQVVDIIRQNPGIDSFMSSVGARAGQGNNQGVIFIRLKDRHQRKSASEIINQLRPKVMSIPGIMTFFQVPPPIRLETRLSKGSYQYTLVSPDMDQLYRTAPKVVSEVRQVAGVTDVTTDLYITNPQVMVEIDRDRAATLHVSPADIELALGSAFGSRQISTIYTDTDNFYVILELLPEYQRSPTDLPLVYIRSASNDLVPLPALAKLTQNVGPLQVNHQGQLPSVTISFNLAPGASIGPVVAQVQQVATRMLPTGLTASFQGSAQVYQSSLGSLTTLLAVAVLVIYLVLGVLYESFIHPLTILSALPFAGFGALGTLWLFGYDLSLYAWVGIIMLVGLVKKNGIMMVDFAIEAQRNENKPPQEAIYEACVVRFRPIMMTTVAALVGTLPIALGIGAGAESRRPLGLAVVGGLLFSQLLTLYVTPVFYLYLERLRTRMMHRHPSPGAVPSQPQLA